MRAILTVDATNEKNGIVNETVLVWNRQWCSDIHYICVSVILILFEGCNMSSNENMTENLQSYLNFLSPGINLEKLFSIATGKTTSLETKEFLHKTYSSILAKHIAFSYVPSSVGEPYAHSIETKLERFIKVFIFL